MIAVFKWVAYDFAAELETVLEKKSSLLSNFNWFLGAIHTQKIRSVRVLLVLLHVGLWTNADLIFQARAWHPVVNGRAGRACMFQRT